MDMRVEKPAAIEQGSTTLLDVTRLSLAELVTSRDTVLDRSIRARLDDIDDDRNPVLSAFGSFISS
jgi:FXSXX-COOH protein